MKIDWIVIIGIGLIMSASVVATIYYYNFKYRECISDPLTYASKDYEEKTGLVFYGSGIFKVPSNTVSPIIYFSSDGIKIEDPTEINFNPSNFILAPINNSG